MRKIKFRAWDDESKKMWYPQAIYADGRNIALVNQFGIQVADMQKDQLMQFTGLKDKNGKEIYESDFVVYDSGNKYEIRFKYGSYWFCKNSTWFGTLQDFTGASHQEELWEIVGNIYENPKLVNDDAKKLD